MYLDDCVCVLSDLSRVKVMVYDIYKSARWVLMAEVSGERYVVDRGQAG